MSNTDVILVFLVVMCCNSATTLEPAVLIDLAVPIRVIGEGCGYENCPSASANALNVHIVPHTHFEMGYWATFDQHFEGSWEDFQHRSKTKISIRKTLDAIISQLWNNKNRRFTLADTSYFFQWWKQRDGTVHRMVYELMRQNRLTFVGGGWSMSDEASTNYQAIIDQHTFGLGKLNATFLDCGRPRVAWQSESYGHSKEFASLMAQMGYDGLFIDPISFDEEVQRMFSKSLEFLWRGNDDLGVASDIFTHKLFDGFYAPPGFCFSRLCEDPLLVTNSELFDNLQERGPYYRTQNIMVVMGHRLGYFDAEIWFDNIDKLIPGINSISVDNKTRIKAFYSTPACYLKAVHDSKPTLPVEQNDFMPYRFNKNSYATGMYTTKSSLKLQIVEANAYLQMSKQLQVLARLRNVDRAMEEFKWIMGIVQDHSIIPGLLSATADSYYTHKIYTAVQRATLTMKRAFDYFRGSDATSEYFRCSFNESICINFNNTRATVMAYNPLGWPVTIPIRLPIVQGTQLLIYDHNGNQVTASVMKTPDPILALNKHHYFKYTHEVVFIANNIPPLGFKAYYSEYIIPTKRKKRALIKLQRRRTFDDGIIIYNKDPMKVKRFDIDQSALIKIQRPRTYEDNKNVNDNKNKMKVKRFDFGPVMQKELSLDNAAYDNITKKPSVRATSIEINKSKTDVETRVMPEFVFDTNVDEDFDKRLRNEIEFREMEYDEIYSTPTKRSNISLPKIPIPKEPALKDKDIDIREGIENYVGNYLTNIEMTKSNDDLMNTNVAEADTTKNIVNTTEETAPSISTTTENEVVVLVEFVNNTDSVHKDRQILLTTENIAIATKNESKTVEIKETIEYFTKRTNYPKWINTDNDVHLRARTYGSYDKNSKSETTTANVDTPRLPEENDNENAIENITQVTPKEIKELMELETTPKEYNAPANIIKYKWDVTTSTEKATIRKFSPENVIPINEIQEQINTESEVMKVLEKSADASELVTDNIVGPNRKTIKHEWKFVMPSTTDIVNIPKLTTTQNVNDFIPRLENSYFLAEITTDTIQVIPIPTSTAKTLIVTTSTKSVSESFIPKRTTTEHVLLPVIENENYGPSVNKTMIRKHNVVGENEITEQLEFGNMDNTENTDITIDDTLSHSSLSNSTLNTANEQTTNKYNETATKNNDKITATENIFDMLSTEKPEFKNKENDDASDQTIIISMDGTSSFTSMLNDSTTETVTEKPENDNDDASEQTKVSSIVDTSSFKSMLIDSITEAVNEEPEFENKDNDDATSTSSKDVISSFKSMLDDSTTAAATDKPEFENKDNDDASEQNIMSSIDDTPSFESMHNDSTTEANTEQTTDDNTEELLNIKIVDENNDSLIQTTTEFVILPILQNITYAPETTTEFDLVTDDIDFLNQSTTENEVLAKLIITEKIGDSTDIPEKNISTSFENNDTPNRTSTDSDILKIFGYSNLATETATLISLEDMTTENYYTDIILTTTESEKHESDVASTEKNYINDVTDINDTTQTTEYELEFIETNENYTSNFTDYDIPVTIESEFNILSITTETNTDIEQLDLKTKYSTDIPKQTITSLIENESNKSFIYDSNVDTEIIINTEETRPEKTTTENYIDVSSIILENSSYTPDKTNACNKATYDINCSNQIITGKELDIKNDKNDTENVVMPEQTIITPITNTPTNDFTIENNIERHDFKTVTETNYVPIRSTSYYDFISKRQKLSNIQATRNKVHEIIFHDFEDDEQSFEAEDVTVSPYENPTTYSGLFVQIFNVSSSGKGGTVFHRAKGMTEKQKMNMKALQKQNKLNTKKAKEDIERQARINKETHEKKNKEDLAIKAKEELEWKAKAYNYNESNDDFIENQHIKIIVDRKTHKITSMNLKEGLTVPLDIQYYYYEPDVPDPNVHAVDDNAFDGPGPHIFRTLNNKPIAILDSVKTEVYKNVLVQEIHTVFSNYTSFAVRLYNDSATLELDWLVGPVPGDGVLGKEVFIRYKTDLVNAGVFYTDSNGRQVMKRIRHSAASIEHFDRVAGNIYPVTSKISIEDTDRNLRFSVFNDRSQGGTSLHDGEIDLMLHRRVLFSNQQLLDERDGNDQPIIVRGKHYIHLGNATHKPNKIYESRLVKEISLMPKISAGRFKGHLKSWLKFKNTVKGLKRKLPIGVHLLTLERWNFNTLLIRFENYLEISDVIVHKTKTVFVKDLFIGIRIKAMKETTLGANQWFEDWDPLRWNKEEKFFKKFNEAFGTLDNEKYDEVFELRPLRNDCMDNGVKLEPQQIRTFVAEFEYV